MTAERGEAPVCVAIDDGCDQTCIVTDAGLAAVYPSRVFAHAHGPLSTREGRYAIGGHHHLTGSCAGPEAPERRVMVYWALQQAGLAGRDVHLVTGASLEGFYRPGTREINQDWIDARQASQQVLVTGEQPAPRIVAHRVTAQSLAAYLHYMTDDEGGFRAQVRPEAPHAVIDVGATHTDCVTVLAGGADMDTAASGTLPIGMDDVCERLGENIRQAFGVAPPHRDALLAILRSGVVRLRGHAHDVASLVERAVAAVTHDIEGALARWLSNGRSVDALLLAGGGATWVQSPLCRAYPNAVVVDDPVMAPARGMLKFLRYGADHG